MASHQIVVDDQVRDAVRAEQPGPAEGGAQLVQATGDQQKGQVADKHLHPLPLAADAQDHKTYELTSWRSLLQMYQAGASLLMQRWCVSLLRSNTVDIIASIQNWCLHPNHT